MESSACFEEDTQKTASTTALELAKVRLMAAEVFK
jgi:hypothetical protein